MLVKNGTAFIGGHFTRADVRVENGKIAQIGDLQPREGEEIRQGRSDNFDGLIEVSEIIRDGLQ